MKSMQPAVNPDIARRIYLIRGRRVMLDRDLAALHGVETRVLNQAVKRNPKRFPSNFMFQLTKTEMKNWVSQIVIPNSSLKMSFRLLPSAFTEHGALQAANVLNSRRAVEMGIYVIQAFVELREILTPHKKLARKLIELEHKIESHDHNIRSLFDAIHGLLNQPEKSRNKIGFRPN